MSLEQASLQRDLATFSRLYDEYGPVVYSLALRIVRRREDAENVVQEVFLAAWNQLDKFDSRKGTLRTWLLTIGRNRSIDCLRSRRSNREVESEGESPDRKASADPSPVEHFFDRERQETVRRALSAINQEQREALELAYFRGLSHSEIAARLGQPLGTVKTRINLGLKKLRESLRSYMGGQR